MVETRLINLNTMGLESFQVGEHMPRYVAASHVWAENLFPVSAFPNVLRTPGISMVMKALDTIPDLENLGRPVYCWVDTWCIDQSDPEDKIRQIPLMGDIFRNAKTVIITVATIFSFTQLEWDFAIQGCLEILELYRYPTYKYNEITKEQHGEYLTRDSAGCLFQAYAILVEIACLRWATRIWTAQEYLVAKSEIFIDSKHQTLRLSLADMTATFEARFAQQEALRLHQVRIRARLNFSKTEEDALANLDLMNRIKEGSLSRVEAMILAQSRYCTVKGDEIYALMGASGVGFTPKKGESLEQAWEAWWAASLRSGYLLFAMCPALSINPDHRVYSSNCIMPPCGERFAMGNATYSKALAWEGTDVQNGTLSVLGKVVGICRVDRYLCNGILPRSIEEFSRLCGDDRELTLKVCLAMNVSQRSLSQIIDTMVDAICAFHRLTYFHAELNDDERQTLLRTSHQFEPFSWVGPHYAYEKIYLGRLVSNQVTTNVLITSGQDFPIAGNLLALDLGRPTDTQHPLKLLMVVREPEDQNHSMHKFGMTYPTSFHNAEGDVSSCCTGHVHDSDIQRFSIGGADCEVCHELAPALPIRFRNWLQRLKQLLIGSK